MRKKTVLWQTTSLTAASLLVILGGISSGCGSRNLYKHTKLVDPPVLERGFVHMTREGILDAGQDPVEFGAPLATRDTIYLPSETHGIEAFEKSTFRRLWRLDIKNGLSSELLLGQSGITNALYFGANDGNFYAVDAEFGKVLWKYETKAPVFARATIAMNRIFISSSDDIVYCLDANTGKWLWHYKRGGNYITTVHGNSTTLVVGTLAYVGFSDGYFVALNVSDGNLVWEAKIHKGSKFTDVDAMALLDGDTLYVPSYDGELYALDKLKGKVRWHIDVGGSKKILIDQDMLYLASSNGHIYSIKKDSGRIFWKFELDEGTPTGLVQYGTFLAFGSSRQYFYAIHKGDGTLAYRFNAGVRSGFFANPSLLDRDIYALSSFGNLYIFRWAR